MREQAELVGRHQVVLGPRGAGFTHLLWAREAPQAAVELMAAGMGSLAFALISSRLGIDHRTHVADALPSENGPNYPDLKVAPERVVAVLE